MISPSGRGDKMQSRPPSRSNGLGGSPPSGLRHCARRRPSRRQQGRGQPGQEPSLRLYVANPSLIGVVPGTEPPWLDSRNAWTTKSRESTSGGNSVEQNHGTSTLLTNPFCTSAGRSLATRTFRRRARRHCHQKRSSTVSSGCSKRTGSNGGAAQRKSPWRLVARAPSLCCLRLCHVVRPDQEAWARLPVLSLPDRDEAGPGCVFHRLPARWQGRALSSSTRSGTDWR